ncbi:MAG: glycosyltransferase, partial [Finegoldia sp.]|uniref:glycosyltransferase n=1 Tax=Finegoldia sp. TaxID=1981334 RepID=UPI003990E147
SKLLYQKGITQFRCVFTLKGNENSRISRIQEEAVDCGMDFLWVGQQNREQMSDWYAQSILLFPSYLETVGLPICEAMSVGAPVLLSDCLYARDVAKEYANARYFVKDNAAALAQLMEVCIVKTG